MKPIVVYACRHCGASAPGFGSGVCFSCGVRAVGVVPARVSSSNAEDEVQNLSDVGAEDVPRLVTGISSLDDALGGGFAFPSVVQFAGLPGIGKSTLLLQVADLLARDHRVLIATSEERSEAIGARARRVGCKHLNKVKIIATRSPAKLKEMTIKTKAEFVLVDSLNGMRADDEVRHSQYATREIALDLIDFAHAKEEYEGQHDQVTMVLVCHLNKQMDVSGVKEIEYMCDVAAWFRGRRKGHLRRFELEKNRFGATYDHAAFSMGVAGRLSELSEEQEKDLERHERKEEPSAT